MDLFDYLRKGKINTFEESFGATNTNFIDFAEKVNSPFHGLLGYRKKLDNQTAAKFSDTTIWTCLNGIYTLVRSDPNIAVVGNWVVGRPLFWVDKTKRTVTPVVANASTLEYAGQALGPLTKAGSYKIIQLEGDAPILYDAALTKAAVINDPVVLKIAGNLATGDTILDATAFDNTVAKRIIGYADEAAVAGAVKRMYLSGAHVNMNRGVM